MLKKLLGKLVAMATKKRLSLIYELENFANTYLGKVTKFQGDGLFRFGVLNNLLAWKWKTPPGMNRIKYQQFWNKSRESIHLPRMTDQLNITYIPLSKSNVTS